MWSHTLLNEGFGPLLFCLFVCFFVCLFVCCGKRMSQYSIYQTWRFGNIQPEGFLLVLYIESLSGAFVGEVWSRYGSTGSLPSCTSLSLWHMCKKISSNTWNILLALCTDTVACSGNIKQPNFSPLSQRCSVIVHAHMARLLSRTDTWPHLCMTKLVYHVPAKPLMHLWSQ